jgi:hypothetical protein
MYPLFLQDFDKTLIFLTDFRKNTNIPNLTIIRAVGAVLFRADGRTDGRTDGQAEMTKLIVAFRNFANAPKNKSDTSK